MSAKRPYHHGNLRQAVLDQAIAELRDREWAELSLRELAEQVGVSHAAPRRYFPERRALSEALANEGFTMLEATLHEAAENRESPAAGLRAIADAYVEFAITQKHLVTIMFAHDHPPDVGKRAAESLAPLLTTLERGSDEGSFAELQPEEAGLQLLATLIGIADLIKCGIVPAGRRDGMVDRALSQITSG